MNVIMPEFGINERVLIGPEHDIPALVTGVCVDVDYLLTYRCTWMQERYKQTSWLYASEVKKTGKEKNGFAIGFEKEKP